MNTIYIHCGFPKTGSSALQSSFAKNRDLLKDDNILYPAISDLTDASAGKISSGNAYLLAYFCINEDYSSINTIASQVLKLLENNNFSMLLSSEHFSILSNRVLCDLVNLLNINHQVHLIYFTRNQFHCWNSSYGQRIKRGLETRGPKVYFEQNFEDFKDGHNNYYYFFNNLKSQLPAKTKISIIPYEFRVNLSGGIGQLFSEIIGVNSDYLHINEVVNRSLPPEELSILLKLNKYSVNPLLSDKITNLQRDCISNDVSYIPDDYFEVFVDAFQSSNERFFNEYFNINNIYDFPRNLPYCDLSDDKLSAGKIADFTACYIADFDRRIRDLENSLGLPKKLPLSS